MTIWHLVWLERFHMTHIQLSVTITNSTPTQTLEMKWNHRKNGTLFSSENIFSGLWISCHCIEIYRFAKGLIYISNISELFIQWIYEWYLFPSNSEKNTGILFRHDTWVTNVCVRACVRMKVYIPAYKLNKHFIGIGFRWLFMCII